MLIRHKVRTAQPQNAVGVDWGNPITRGLGLLLPLRGRGDRIDAVTGRTVAFGSAVGNATSSFGTSASFGSASAFADFPQPIGISGNTQPITFSWISEGRSASGYSTIFTWKAPGATRPFLVYRAASDSTYEFTVGPRQSAGGARFSTGLQTNNVPERFVLVCRGGVGSTTTADYSLFRNGVPVPTNGASAFGDSTVDVSRIGATESGGDPFEGLIANFAVFGRALSAAEAASLSANPWQLFAQVSEPIQVLPTVVGGSIGAASGVATAVGQGRTLFTAQGAAAGAATASGASVSPASTGVSSGVATVAGQGASRALASGAIGGVTTTAGVGAARALTSGSAPGVADALATGLSQALTQGSAAGFATASGTSGSAQASSGAAAGSATAAAVGASLALGQGAAAGVATVAGFPAAVIPAGASSGIASAQGAGRALVLTNGVAAGISVVNGVSVGVIVHEVLVPMQIVSAAVATLQAALVPQGIKVYRRRVRAFNRSDQRGVIVGLAGSRGERYAIDGSADWRVTLRIVAFARALEEDDGFSADEAAGQVMLAAHNALASNPSLGISGLDWDNAFSLAEDDEDFEEELSVLVATYDYQICTQGTAATV